ncbi:hypothetical protein VW29_04275 [Devosia limi DSM 17137]|uniref:Simple sugar transport system substrate-binding protein n=2 Tax=Devosia TaxID=46913 RepID=A0A0F5LUV2_9HYPH|nr:hypothetical protein VW29_04275 [Devosia limi DSM 17137]SHF85278.1 simple sugar transport system substrate-binding protein [Devosia limi DSM 17137]
MHKWTSRILTTLALSVSITGTAFAEPFKIGYLLPNPVSEIGWSSELAAGGRALEEHFGDKVELQMIENLGEGPDSARVMNKMAADGVGMLILGSFAYQQEGVKLAARYPDLKVVHIGGYLQGPNFSTLTPRHYEAAYLCGMASGMATETNSLGVIAAFPLPEVLNIMNAYVLGAQRSNPDIEPVKVIWLNSWFDPANEKASTESFASQSVDVVFSLFPGTPAPVVAAEELGIYVTVTHSDNSRFAPNRHLCAGQLHFGPTLITKVQEAMDGAFQENDIFAGVQDGTIEAAGLGGPLTQAQKDEILAVQEEMRAGTFNPFTGPIAAMDGAEMIAAGAALDDGAIKGMNFLVQGINTNLPK